MTQSPGVHHKYNMLVRLQSLPDEVAREALEKGIAALVVSWMRGWAELSTIWLQPT